MNVHKRTYKILLKSLTNPGEATTFLTPGGEATVNAYSHAEALERFCANPANGWRPPAPGERYDYAVHAVGTGSIKLFTIDPTPGYTINPA